MDDDILLEVGATVASPTSMVRVGLCLGVCAIIIDFTKVLFVPCIGINYFSSKKHISQMIRIQVIR